MPTFPYGWTVIVHRVEVTGQNADGNDVTSTVDYNISGVAVWPRTSTEVVQGQDTTIIGSSMLLPPELDFDIHATDRVSIFDKLYEIDGEPGRYLSPLTGFDAGTLINLKRVV